MKKHILTLALCILALPALASANTTGYAWSESTGWFDFSSVVVTDTQVTGVAYNDNTGWLSFETGTNVTNADGTLSGYAWSESTGWFDFSNAYVENGQFKGYAYNDNTGWLTFGTGTTVTTTWTTAAPSAPRRSSSSGSRPVEAPIPTTLIPGTQVLPETIEGLQVLVTQLQAQLAQLLSKASTAVSNVFTRNLDVHSRGPDVVRLQTILMSKGYSIPAGATGYFGMQTWGALSSYQKDSGIVPSSGFFGPITRQALSN